MDSGQWTVMSELTIDNGQLTIFAGRNRCIVGVVLRAANQNLLIAGGNHTIIPSATLSPAPERTESFPKIPENVPHFVIPTAAQAEWRNPPRGRKYQLKVKSATWEDFSTHCVRSE